MERTEPSGLGGVALHPAGSQSAFVTPSSSAQGLAEVEYETTPGCEVVTLLANSGANAELRARPLTVVSPGWARVSMTTIRSAVTTGSALVMTPS